MADCLFCKIAAKEIPSKVVYEDDRIMAFQDVNPQAPTHDLLIPKKHIDRVADINEEDGGLLGELIFRAKEIAQEKKLSDSGFRLVFNSGAGAGQTVFHIHLHLLGGRDMTWPPG